MSHCELGGRRERSLESGEWEEERCEGDWLESVVLGVVVEVGGQSLRSEGGGGGSVDVF